jgi:hypothetical protein
MTSIDDLARRLEQIDSTFDKDTQLKHWSFEKTQNNSFGVKTSADKPDKGSTDFTVFLNFDPKWPSKEIVPGKPCKDSTEVKTSFPSPLQKAFKQVLAAGEDTMGKTCFIDMATLNPSSDFFNEGDKESVATALLNAVDNIDLGEKPVIRIVCGDWVGGDPKTWESVSRGWRIKFEEMFWDKGESRLRKNKNATLWVGYYRPILATTGE